MKLIYMCGVMRLWLCYWVLNLCYQICAKVILELEFERWVSVGVWVQGDRHKAIMSNSLYKKFECYKFSQDYWLSGILTACTMHAETDLRQRICRAIEGYYFLHIRDYTQKNLRKIIGLVFSLSAMPLFFYENRHL